MHRQLIWPDLLNARDLGGLVSASGLQTVWRRLVRADNLNKLTPAGVAAMTAYGVRTVIDLRDPRELEKFPNPLAAAPPDGVIFENLPVVSDANWEAFKDPTWMTEGYALMTRLSRDNIAKVVAAVADARPGGIVIHCHAGKERTGVVAALLLSLAGVPDETVADDWAVTDEYLQPLYHEWVANEADPAVRAKRLEGFATRPEHIVDVLTYVRRTHGSVDAYLLAGGVTARQVDRLRRRLVSSDGAQ